MNNDDFIRMVLSKAEYSEDQIDQVLKMKTAPSEEPAEIPEKVPEQPEPEKAKEPEASKDTSDELEKLRRQLEETQKQLQQVQKENSTKDNSNQPKLTAQEQLNEIARRFM